MESPVSQYSSLSSNTSHLADYVFFAIFLLEFLLKIIDRGVYWEHPNAFFRLSWNILDFL